MSLDPSPQPLPADLRTLRDAIGNMLTDAGVVTTAAWNAKAGDATLRETFDRLFEDYVTAKAKAPTLTRWVKGSKNPKHWLDPIEYWNEGEGATLLSSLRGDYKLPRAPFTSMTLDHGSQVGLLAIIIGGLDAMWPVEAEPYPLLWAALNHGQPDAELLATLNAQFTFTAKGMRAAAADAADLAAFNKKMFEAVGKTWIGEEGGES